MDVKAPLDKYDSATNVSVDIKKIELSIYTILNSGLDHSFRTTVVPGLTTKSDLGRFVECFREPAAT